MLGGFEQLNQVAAKMEDGGWIAGTPGVSQADVTTAVAFSFASLARPDLELPQRFLWLARFTERCEAMPEFSRSPIPGITRLTPLLAKPFVA